MGRYYHTNNHEGKFGFGIQSSDDAQIFGMEEQAPTELYYYLEDSDENRAYIDKVLDEQYDILGIPYEDRIYQFVTIRDVFDLIDKYHDKNYHPATDEDKAKRLMVYHDEKISEGVVPNNVSVPLAECRLELGLIIKDELVKEGYCDLTAEL